METEPVFTVDVRNHVLNPAEAEIRITTRLTDLHAKLELRGRLMGPRCPYATTVEVAYPLRPLPTSRAKEDAVEARVIIPEPNLWEPQAPFIYAGPVELWHDDRKVGQITITHALRTLRLSRRGLRLNGHPLQVRGVAGSRFTEEELRSLHDAGCNLLLAPVPVGSAFLWYRAEEYGFLMLGRISVDDTEEILWHAEGFLCHQTSCFGWLLPQQWLTTSYPWQAAIRLLYEDRDNWVGIELSEVPPAPLPDEVSFLACTAQLLPQVAHIPLPKLLLREQAAQGAENWVEAIASPDLLGWVSATP
jgi:hypothetical protein